MDEDIGLRLDDDEVLIERARYTRALSAQLKKLHDEAKRQGQIVPLDITENLAELQLVPIRSRQRLPRSVIHKIYPPSKASFDNLSPIAIKTLTPHTPHTGKSLLVYTTAEPVRIGQKSNSNPVTKHTSSCTYISVAVADKLHGANRTSAILELYNCYIRLPLDEILPRGSTLQIKEPYYTLTSAPNSDKLVIRVDHPTDVEIIYPFASEQPSSHWKRLGDAAFGLKRYHEAAAWLTKGLEVLRTESDRLKGGSAEEREKLRRARIAMLSNRALTRLEQGRFDDCIEDCNHILSVENNFKAIYRRAAAVYALGTGITLDRVEISSLIQHCDQHPDDRTDAVMRLLEKIETDVLHRGKYSWPALYKLAESRTPISCPNFEHPALKLVEFPGRGRGVVATTHIPAGTLVVVSTSSVVLFRQDPEALSSIRIDTVKSRCDVGESNELSALLTGKLHHNPSLRKQMYHLYAGQEYEPGLAKDDHSIDAFRMYGVQLHNSFDLDGTEIQLSCFPVAKSMSKQNSGTGIWYFPSFFNHSCINNCSRTFISNLLVIKTSRNIQACEELTLGYVNKLHDYLDRKDCFYDFGFECRCPLCKLDGRQTEDHFEEVEFREKAIETYKQFAAESMVKGYITTEEMRTSAVSVAKLIDDLCKSYDRSGVVSMRYGLLRPLNALCTLNLRLKEWSSALANAKALLELSPPDHGVDDLTVGARTLVAALQIKISFNANPTAAQTLEINHSLSKVVEAWNIRGLVSGFGGYWEEFGQWWHDFLACSKVREDSTRQRILRAFLEASR